MTILILGNINHVETVLQSSYDMIQDSYDFGVQMDIESSLTILVISEIISGVASVGVSSDLYSEYAIREYLFSTKESFYSILVIGETSSAVSALGVSSDIDMVYNIGQLFKDIEAVYSIRIPVSDDSLYRYDLSRFKAYIEHTCEHALTVSDDIYSDYLLRHSLYSDTEIPYLILAEHFSETESLFDLLTTTSIESFLRVVYTIYDPTSENIVTDVIVSINGININFDNMSLSIDESSYCWALTGNLSAVSDWSLCIPGTELLVTVGSDDYLFIIDTRNSDTAFNSENYSINARSITSVYGEGAEPIHDTWPATTTDSVINSLINVAEINIGSWNLTDDLLVAEGDTPIAVVKKITEARGGIIYTKGDGTLVIEKKYKQEPPLYDINNTDHSISDLDDIYSISESREVKAGYNQVEVSDEPDSSSTFISIVTKENTLDKANLTAIIVVRIYPFSDYIELLSSHDDIIITPSTVPLYEEISETIEIVDGVGSTSQAVYNIISTDYQDDDMGAISHKGSSITTEIAGITLLNITYRTQYHELLLIAQDAEKIQIYLEDN